ncbi:phosphomannomutase/phosphoglucomutase [Candidatus Gottesmanbacteria bacterium]|nr:phosphomannomutase/phosphoglucomutase [Candidatus Gottesmanbacteria bacterium]
MNWDLIFHQYDIRGIYPTQLNEDTYYILGRALATYLKAGDIAVGYDTRLSSPTLFKAFTSGIADQGLDVVSLGLTSTEINYFASGKYGFTANAIISASHNPAEYNGLKIVTKGVIPLNGDFGLPEIKKLAKANKFTSPVRKGQISNLNVTDDWINHVLKFIDISKLRKLKVVIDAGNGMGGLSWEKLKKKLPLDIIPLYFKPDGHFPHHLPDPLKPENVIDLQHEIKKHKADLGFAIDGDADRIFVLDEHGISVSGTIATAMLSQYLLQESGPSTILYNAVCGKIVPETVKLFKGIPIRVRVGHSYIKEQMKKENALFAGEHSGHFYFRENFFADSSTVAGLLLLEYISKQNKPLSEITKNFDKYFSSGEINYNVSDGQKVIEAIEKQFQDSNTDFIDGLSVWYPKWWFSLRTSNTEPMVRLNLEADTQEILDEKLSLVDNELRQMGAHRNE